MIRLKTAELFEGLFAWGPGGRCGRAFDGWSVWPSFGNCHELFDDLVDLYAEEEMIGKTLGTDLEKGKFTLPLLLLLERLPEAERANLLQRQRKGDPTVIPEFCQRLRDYPIFEAVEAAGEDEIALDAQLGEVFPEDLRVAEWNREITQKGRTEAGREFLAESLTNMGTPEMIGEIECVMDMIDFDEGRIPGFSNDRRKKWESRQTSA